MVARDFQTLARARAARARELAARYPASREVLELIAAVVDWQASAFPGDPLRDLPVLLAGLAARAPERLAETARSLDRATCEAAMERYLASGDDGSPLTFFARVLLQPLKFGAPAGAHGVSAVCPCCGQPPQAGVLEDLAHGQALWLSCSLCFHKWEFPRRRCVGCGHTGAQGLAFYKADELPHLQVMTCEECRQYLHLIDAAKEPAVIADIDELAALPLDVWAVERGYSKLQPNLAGV